MIYNTAKKIFFFFQKLNLKRKHQLKLGKNVTIRRSTFEGNNFLAFDSFLIDSHIGFASYLAERTIIRHTKIGRFSSIGPDVKCIFGKHPTDTFVSTHPSFFSLLKQSGFTYVESQLFEEYENPLDTDKKYQIAIGNDVWIGANVSIMDGITIGNGAIVATCACVVKDVPPYAIVGGVPAKIIKYRFDDNEINFLEKFQWWDRDQEWIKKNITQFNDIKSFHKTFN